MATNFFQIQSQATFLYGVLGDYLSQEEVKLVKRLIRLQIKRILANSENQEKPILAIHYQ